MIESMLEKRRRYCRTSKGYMDEQMNVLINPFYGQEEIDEIYEMKAHRIYMGILRLIGPIVNKLAKRAGEE